VSCNKTEDPVKTPLFKTVEGFFILNEGAFGQGNASVSYYNIGTDSISHNIYENANASKLGDVLQSMTIVDDKAYLVMNNSAYIKVVDATDFEEIATIEGFTSPRYMQIINSKEAYVSDIYAGNIWVVDLENNLITDSIPVPGWTEEMVLVGQKLFVTSPTIYGNPTSKELYVIDINTRTVQEAISLKANPNNILLDNEGMLNVFCLGDPFSTPKIAPSFYRINPADFSDKSFFNMPGLPDAYSGQLAFDTDSKKIYILYGSVYYADILDIGLSWANAPIVESDGKSFYGLNVDPVTGDLFIMDAKDFNQAGKIYQYKSNGNFNREFGTGIVPSKIVFY